MKLFTKIIGLVGIGLFLFIALSFKNNITFESSEDLVLAQELSVASPRPASSSFSLLEKVKEGKQLLKSSPPLLVQGGSKQIALAILDQNTGKLFEKRVWVKESDIRSKVLGSVPLQPVDPREPLKIRVKWWNSFNSPYEIVGHPNMLVVANKYPMPTASVPFPKERQKGPYSEIIYVPYSDGLRTEELVKAGKDHIDQMVDAAFGSLKLRGVKSRLEPGKLVTDMVNKDFIKNIVVVEHIDPGAFDVSIDKGKMLTDRVLVIIGTNGDHAYSYTGSPAGASGIAQFIKPTYNTTRNNYPAAGLIKDFSLGMADHENAFKSMVLFFDSHEKAIQDKITRKDILNQMGGISEEMLALAYNGGPSKVIRSVNTYGSAWISSQTKPPRPIIFRPETLGYFNKFQAVKKLDIF